MPFEVVAVPQYQQDLIHNVSDDDRSAVRRRADALATNRAGARLAGPLQECRELTVLGRYVLTYLEKPGQQKVVLVGVRRTS